MSILFKDENEQKQFSKKENKRSLDREEKKLGKIADKNTKVIRDVRTKALARRK